MKLHEAKLHEIAHARSGDKGSTADISVIAHRSADYPRLCTLLTPERVREHFADLPMGPVRRHEVPSLHALKFVLYGALDGGVTRSLGLDAHGKSLAACLLEMDVPELPPTPSED
ncbi:AtuA-related protein [Streptomyces phaeochromogenes]|uniref:AtuA-related protein n=1 Tax=Streptomyces phaeochromogenes TaxID=1923 RepID=UPI003402C94A